MNLTNNIKFKSFNFKSSKKKIKILLKILLSEDNQILSSLSESYKNSYNKKKIQKFKNYSNIALIGMGGSILGAKSIYNFLKDKIKKNFFFIDNFESKNIRNVLNKKRLNLIISKSGNTLETIANSNVLIDQKVKNIFVTENKNSYLRSLANKLKSEIISHNNYIGGRYSVLSEVGILPAELMGLKVNKFRTLNKLIKNKFFINSLINNVSDILNLAKNKKTNSIILNYDEKSSDLFYWYQQLIAESLGKKSKGILPIVSRMPQDNHSLMQLYLDGKKNNFYTFFFVKENSLNYIKNQSVLSSHKYLMNKNLDDILYAQFIATQNVFKKKKYLLEVFL